MNEYIRIGECNKCGECCAKPVYGKEVDCPYLLPKNELGQRLCSIWDKRKEMGKEGCINAPYHPNHVKDCPSCSYSWIKKQNSPLVKAGSGTTDSNGTATISFTSDMPDTNYAILLAAENGTDTIMIMWYDKVVGGFKVKTEDDAGKDEPNVPFNYVAIQYGEWTVDGVDVKAGGDTTDADGYKQVVFTTSFTVEFNAVVSPKDITTDTTFARAWHLVTERDDFEVRTYDDLGKDEANVPFDWLAIEKGEHTIQGKEIKVGKDDTIPSNPVTVTFSSAMPSTNYSVIGCQTAVYSDTCVTMWLDKATGSFKMKTEDDGGGDDDSYFAWMVFEYGEYDLGAAIETILKEASATSDALGLQGLRISIAKLASTTSTAIDYVVKVLVAIIINKIASITNQATQILSPIFNFYKLSSASSLAVSTRKLIANVFNIAGITGSAVTLRNLVFNLIQSAPAELSSIFTIPITKIVNKVASATSQSIETLSAILNIIKTGSSTAQAIIKEQIINNILELAAITSSATVEIIKITLAIINEIASVTVQGVKRIYSTFNLRNLTSSQALVSIKQETINNLLKLADITASVIDYISLVRIINKIASSNVSALVTHQLQVAIKKLASTTSSAIKYVEKVVIGIYYILETASSQASALPSMLTILHIIEEALASTLASAYQKLTKTINKIGSTTVSTVTSLGLTFNILKDVLGSSQALTWVKSIFNLRRTASVVSQGIGVIRSIMSLIKTASTSASAIVYARLIKIINLLGTTGALATSQIKSLFSITKLASATSLGIEKLSLIFNILKISSASSQSVYSIQEIVSILKTSSINASVYMFKQLILNIRKLASATSSAIDYVFKVLVGIYEIYLTASTTISAPILLRTSFLIRKLSQITSSATSLVYKVVPYIMINVTAGVLSASYSLPRIIFNIRKSTVVNSLASLLLLIHRYLLRQDITIEQVKEMLFEILRRKGLISFDEYKMIIEGVD